MTYDGETSTTSSRSHEPRRAQRRSRVSFRWAPPVMPRSEEHTSELQSRQYLVCRLLLEKKKKQHQDLWRPPGRCGGRRHAAARFRDWGRIGSHQTCNQATKISRLLYFVCKQYN